MRFLFSFISLLSISFTAFGKFVPGKFSLDFEESYVSMIDGKTKKSKGKLDYSHPGKVRLRKFDPESLVVSDGVKNWFYQPPFIEGEKGQVTIQKSSNFNLVKIFDVLSKGLKSNKYFSYKSNGNTLLLKFTSKMAKNLSVLKIKLQGPKVFKDVQSIFDYDQMKVFYMDGREVLVSFLDVKTNSKFSANHFYFVPPKNTEVIKK